MSRIIIIERHEFPDCIRDIQEVSGISVGGCVCPTDGLYKQQGQASESASEEL